ncbi:unnamed protein product [Pedinophyceae sp. YPF-701]|nr:unnamed protein product [Pedinophyceae sp. YPF-701]
MVDERRRSRARDRDEERRRKRSRWDSGGGGEDAKRSRDRGAEPSPAAATTPAATSGVRRRRASKWGDAPSNALAAASAVPSAPMGALPGYSGAGGPGSMLGGYPGATQAHPGNALALAGQQKPSEYMTIAERQAMKVYCGNMPRDGNVQELVQQFNEAYLRINPAAAITGELPIRDGMINAEKQFGFLETTHSDHATVIICMMDGFIYRGTALRLRRPKDYFPPAESDQDVLARVLPGARIPINQEIPADPEVPLSPYRIFVGNLHPLLNEAELKELFTALGQLQSFKLIKSSPDAELSEGRCYFAFKDPATTPRALAALRGVRVMERLLIPAPCCDIELVNRWWEDLAEHGHRAGVAPELTPDAEELLKRGAADAEKGEYHYEVPEWITPLILKPGLKPTRVLEISNALTEDAEELRPDGAAEAVENDFREEGRRFGHVKSVQVTTPMDGERLRAERDAQMAEAKAKAEAAEAAAAAAAGEGGDGKEEGGDVGPASGDGGDAGNGVAVKKEDEGAVGDADPGSPKLPADTVGGDAPPGDSKALMVDGQAQEGQPLSCFEKPRVLLAPDGRASGLGKVYIEFARPESATECAVQLHGRKFNGRIMRVRYFPLKTYQRWFRKGLVPTTNAEKQAMAMAVQEKLTTAAYGPMPDSWVDPLTGMTAKDARMSFNAVPPPSLMPPPGPPR